MNESSIRKRPLGRTGLEVTEVSVGGFFFDEATGTKREEAVRAIHRALDLGVNCFDTAPYYGTSQEILGEALAAREEDHILTTKCGRFDWKTGPYRELDAFKIQLEESLKLLRRESVDVLFLHEADWPVYWEELEIPRPNRVLDVKGTYDYEDSAALIFLRWAREQGLAKHVGLSGNNSHLLAKLIREIDLNIEVVLVAFQYDPIWRNARQYLLPLTSERGVGVVLGAPLQQGRLVEPHEEWLRDPPAWMGDETRERFRALYEIRRDAGLTLPELVLRFLLADPDICTISAGVSTVEQLEKNVRCTQAAPLPDEIHSRIEALGRLYPGIYRNNARR